MLRVICPEPKLSTVLCQLVHGQRWRIGCIRKLYMQVILHKYAGNRAKCGISFVILRLERCL
nr:MAG TPA: hypothetical protein [Caudoviricetes sp.]